MPSMAAGSAVGGYVCFTAASGVIVEDTAATCPVSAERFKKNIHDLSDAMGWSAMKLIDCLRPVGYRMRDEYNVQHRGELFGFTAEQVFKCDGRLVDYDKDGKPITVMYDRVPVVLVAAQSALQRQVHELGIAVLALLSWGVFLQWKILRLHERISAGFAR